MASVPAWHHSPQVDLTGLKAFSLCQLMWSVLIVAILASVRLMWLFHKESSVGMSESQEDDKEHMYESVICGHNNDNNFLSPFTGEFHHPVRVVLHLPPHPICALYWLIHAETSISSLKKSWGASAPKLKPLAVQWLSSNLCKVGSYVAIGVIQSKVAVLNHP